MVLFNEITQTRQQQKTYHALIGEVHDAMRGVGSSWDLDDWKRLLIDQWAAESGDQQGRVVPSLDGQRTVQLGRQSRHFNRQQAASFIDFLFAWGTLRGVTFKEQRID